MTEKLTRLGRTRDADRSKDAILDAAEALFARQGFERVSLQAIAERAGVSKGLPIYFFGSKDALRRSVFNRLYARAVKTMAPRPGEDEPLDAPARMDRAVDAYLDFLVANPNFVRLMARAALDGLPPEEAAIDGQAVGGALAQLADPAFAQALRDDDPAQTLLSVMAVCVFPLTQADHLLRSLGRDPYDPAFLEARRAHVKALLRYGLFR